MSRWTAASGPNNPFEDLVVDTLGFKKAARAMAEALTDRIIDLEQNVPGTEPRGPAGNDDDGLVKIVDGLQDEHLTDLVAQANRLTAAMNDFGTALARQMNRIPSGSTPTAKALVLVFRNCEGPRAELDAAADEPGRAWRRTSDDLPKAVSSFHEPGQKDLADQVKQELVGITTGLDTGSLDEMQAVVGRMGLLSASLGPAGRTLSKALSVVTSIRTSADAWVCQL